MRRSGEMGTAQVARVLEVHPCTLWRWAARIEANGRAPLTKFRREYRLANGKTSFIYWNREEVLALKAKITSGAIASD